MKSLIMRFIHLSIFALSLLLSSCSGGNGGNKLTAYSAYSNYEDEAVNEIEQALPTIMVIPSDQLLESNGALKRVGSNGDIIILRDYEKFLLENKENKLMLSAIQDQFVQLGYPLTNLEQSLKSLHTTSAMDKADNLAKDAKTMLLNTVSPDILLELNYNYSIDLNSRKLKKGLTYTINAIDSYTNKVFSSLSKSNLSGETISDAFVPSFRKDISSLSKDIQKYFGDIVYKGREITVRITIDQGSNIKLSDENIYGDTYSDWIIDYIKVKSKKGAYKLQRNSDNELYFVNVRIKNINEDGTQFNAYDWARELCKSLRSECGVKATNRSQGLGEIHITLKGL